MVERASVVVKSLGSTLVGFLRMLDEASGSVKVGLSEVNVH